jgi:hypothetical protein
VVTMCNVLTEAVEDMLIDRCAMVGICPERAVVILAEVAMRRVRILRYADGRIMNPGVECISDVLDVDMERMEDVLFCNATTEREMTQCADNAIVMLFITLDTVTSPLHYCCRN